MASYPRWKYLLVMLVLLTSFIYSLPNLYSSQPAIEIKLNDEEKTIIKIGTELNETLIQKIVEDNIFTLDISVTNSINKGPYLLTTILNDKNNDKNEAITEIYKSELIEFYKKLT